MENDSKDKLKLYPFCSIWSLFLERVVFERCISLRKKAFDEVDWTSNFVQTLVVLPLNDFYASIILPFHWSNHLNRVSSTFTLKENTFTDTPPAVRLMLKNCILSVKHWHDDVRWISFNPFSNEKPPHQNFHFRYIGLSTKVHCNVEMFLSFVIFQMLLKANICLTSEFYTLNHIQGLRIMDS